MIKETLIKNSILTAVILILVGFRRLIFNVSIGRIFGATDLGLVNIALSIVLLLAAIVTFFKGATTKYMSEYMGMGDVDSAKTMFRIGFFFTLFLSIVAILIAFIMRDWFLHERGIEMGLFLLAVPLIPLSGFYAHYALIYYGINRVKHYFIAQFFSSILFFACLGIVVFYLKSLFLLPFIALYLPFFIISTYLFRSYFKPANATNVDKKIITLKATKFASFVLIGNLVGIASTELSVILTSAYVSAAWIGYYAAAYALLKPLHLIPDALRPVIYPSQSYQYGKGNSDLINKTLDVSTRWLIVLTSFLCGLYILLSNFILEIVFGTSYTIASTTMQILCIGMLCSIIAVPANNTLIGTKYVHTQAIISIISFIAMVGSWSLLIPMYGIIGTALGFCFSQIIFTILLMYYAHKFFDLDLKSNSKVILFFSLILMISLIIQQFCQYYPTAISVGIFTVVFALINKRDLQDIFKEIFSTLSKSRSWC